jgi:hypothetical protein
MRDLDLPRGDGRELVVDRDRVYELDGEDSRALAAVGAFRIVPEHDLDLPHDTLADPTTPRSSLQVEASGANVNDADAWGVSATVLAAHGGFTELVVWLVDRGADPTRRRLHRHARAIMRRHIKSRGRRSQIR